MNDKLEKRKNKTTEEWNGFIEATAQKNLKLRGAIAKPKNFCRFRSGFMHKREFI